MEKPEFVAQAPLYYALAIAAYLVKSSSDTVSRQDIEHDYSYSVESSTVCVVKLDCVWRAAVRWLVERDLIVEKKGAFGPELYSKPKTFMPRWSALLRSEVPFSHYNSVGDKNSFLRSALTDVSSAYRDLNISPRDFEFPDAEWEPIQFDTSDADAKHAIEKLSEAVEEIRKENGYAANVPEERNYVVTGLEGAVEKLKSGTIAAGYLRDAWARLTLVGRRFAGASLELVVTGAKQAIMEFVKSQGGELLRSLLNLFH